MDERILAFGATDTGPRKKVNEDSFFYAVGRYGEMPAGIFTVADGVSSSACGEIASSICAETIQQWWNVEFPTISKKEKLVPSLAECIIDLNRTVSGMEVGGGYSASTLTLLLLVGDEWLTFNVGDSRIYRASGIFHSLEQLTEDQTCMVERELNGKKYMKSVLTSCIGGRNILQYGFREGKAKAGDRFLLCSDGVYKTASERRLQKLLSKRAFSPEALCNAVIREALSNGETDNITAISVFLNG